MDERGSGQSSNGRDSKLPGRLPDRLSGRLWRALVEQSRDAVALLRAKDRIWYVNPAATSLFGHSAAELANRSILEFIHPDEQESIGKDLAKLTDKPPEAVPLIFRVRQPNGPCRWVEAIVSNLLADRRVQAIVLQLRDITARRSLEGQLRRRAEELEESHRHKDEFLAMLGHELRNPLAPIRNALHMLHRHGPDPATLAWAHDVTQRQVRHLTRLVDDLLDVSRIDRGKIRLRCERINLCEVVRRTVEDHQGDVEEAGLRIEMQMPESPVWVTGDPTRLAQVVGNLLNNAVKFTDPGGLISVSVKTTHRNGRVHVTVGDTGIGIEPTKLQRIFDRFSQEERALDRNRGGLGLGLALVKGLVELHSGAVTASSPGPGKGTNVTFWLPCERGSEIVQSLPAPGLATGQGLCILIIEDYRDVAETLQRFLEFSGHRVAIAHSGPAGVAVAREMQPDVVLCDLGLPGMDGLEVARALRQDPLTARARLIVMSGYGSESDQQRCLKAGYELHLTKPVDPEQLERILADVH